MKKSNIRKTLEVVGRDVLALSNLYHTVHKGFNGLDKDTILGEIRSKVSSYKLKLLSEKKMEDAVKQQEDRKRNRKRA